MAEVYKLTDLQRPTISWEQVAAYTPEKLRARADRTFDAHQAFELVSAAEGAQMYAIDLGGGKIRGELLTLSGGNFSLVSGFSRSLESRNGDGYLAALEQMADIAHERRVPVGISVAGLLTGTALQWSENLKTLVGEFGQKYRGDFRYLFGESVSVANDAVAGIMRGSVAAVHQYPETENTILAINGGGIGGAVKDKNQIFALEPGHVLVEHTLNPYDISTACGAEGETGVCVERVGSSVSIEQIWREYTGKSLTGVEISTRLGQRDTFALELYENSATILAHVIVGIAKAQGDLLAPGQKTAIICHGGSFEVEGYGERVMQIVEYMVGSRPPVIFTRDITQHTTGNACLEGAGISALISSVS